ncbi:zinc finger protein 345-like isoform X1 [Diorhabda sublineata]|uniref:zinc finger protein 345-like isoform X1 n=2 Tax=Diorhabda sublineata TaxID=1163346 RepID=UPI0024E0D4AC|nr:zinc finger protein 345-like isoform X1 [Diorhabda sublineata]
MEMTAPMANGFTYDRISIFGECRNRIKSMWDILFGDEPKQWISFKPTLGAYVYPCYACQTLFSSFSSLQDHVHRRIIILRYKCSRCSGRILRFYNRCTLLLHTRHHYTLKEGQINLADLDTSTLPIDLAGFLPVPNIPLIYENDEEEDVPDNIYVNVQFYWPGEDQKGKAVVVLSPSDFIFRDPNQPLCLKQVCNNIPKCRFITLYDQKRLTERALLTKPNEPELDTNVKIELFDYADRFTMPIISKVESLHEKSYNVPRCLECKSAVSATMLEHYKGSNKPNDLNLTCSICKFVAPTKCSFKAHERIHKNEAPHVCPDCGKDFETSELLHQHMEEVCFHLAKHVKYRCPGKRCSKLFASLANFSSHFSQQHFKCVYTCSVCKCTSYSVSELQKHIEFHDGDCTFSKVYQCGVCTDFGTIGDNEFDKHIEIHSKIDNIMYVYLCKYCRNTFRSTFTFATHLLKCTSKMISDTKLRLKNKPKVLITKKYFCILCNDQIPLEKKVSHMRLCKYARPVVYVNKLDISDISNGIHLNISQENSRSSESPKSEENCKKKRKRYLTDISRRRKPEKVQEPDLIAEKPIEFDGTYYCKLCDYQSRERNEFHDHIRIHRNISTAYQCMECGECFVVKPSLYKHLLHFHNIHNYESYLKDNDCFDVEAVKELENVMRLAPGESKGPVKDNQCRVCLDEFDDSVALNKHFRTHGMAFLLKNSK